MRKVLKVIGAILAIPLAATMLTLDVTKTILGIPSAMLVGIYPEFIEDLSLKMDQIEFIVKQTFKGNRVHIFQSVRVYNDLGDSIMRIQKRDS